MIVLGMAADGLSIRSPQDLWGETGLIDPYWLATFQWTKEINDHNYVKWARKKTEERNKRKKKSKDEKADDDA